MSKKSVSRSTINYVKSNYKKINIDDFVLGDNLFNSRCHVNSVQKIKEGKADTVILCYAIDKETNWSCVHFINRLSDGKYQDNTWGWTHKFYDYYLIKEVAESEYDTIWNLLNTTTEFLFNINSSWIDKLFNKLNIK